MYEQSIQHHCFRRTCGASDSGTAGQGGNIDGSVADKTFSSSGMISRYRFDDGQQIQDIEER